MNATPSVAQRQTLPTAVAGDRLLHILHFARWYCGCTFWRLAILAQQRTLGWKTSELAGGKQAHRRQSREHIEDGTFHRTRAMAGFPARRPIVRHCYLIETLLKQLAGVRKV